MLMLFPKTLLLLFMLPSPDTLWSRSRGRGASPRRTVTAAILREDLLANPFRLDAGRIRCLCGWPYSASLMFFICLE